MAWITILGSRLINIENRERRCIMISIKHCFLFDQKILASAQNMQTKKNPHLQPSLLVTVDYASDTCTLDGTLPTLSMILKLCNVR